MVTGQIMRSAGVNLRLQGHLSDGNIKDLKPLL